MSDLNEQINQFLSDPASMQQLQSVLGSLGMSGNQTPQSKPAPPPQNNSQNGLDLSALSGLLSANSSPQNTAPQAPSQNSAGGGLDISALSGILGSLGGNSQPTQRAPALPSGMNTDMLGSMMKLVPLLSTVNREDDSTRLLRALRPLLSESRRSKVDEAIKILQIMRMLPILKESGVFSSLISGLL